MAVILGLESLSQEGLRELIQKAPKVTIRCSGWKSQGVLISADEVRYYLALEADGKFRIAVFPVANSWLIYDDAITLSGNSNSDWY